MFKLLNEEKGFSLLELIVYVSIVGVLMAVAVPKYEYAIAMSNTARIQSDLNSLDMAIAMYSARNNGTRPTDIQKHLGNYIANIDKVRPPEGKCIIAGNEADIPAAEYSIDTEGRAVCGTSSAADFGNNG